MTTYELYNDLQTGTTANIICNELFEQAAVADTSSTKWVLIDAITVVLFHNRAAETGATRQLIRAAVGDIVFNR